MANELGMAEAFITAQLLAQPVIAATAGAFSGGAPRGTPPPFVIFTYQGARETTVNDSRRIAVEPLYLVRAVMQTGQLADVQSLADAIDVALDRQGGSGPGYRIAQCVREGPYELTDTSTEIPWRSLGGYYRVTINLPGD